MEQIIMGLDASTRTIGLSILIWDGLQESVPVLKHVEFYCPNKKDDLFLRLSKVRKFIIDRIKQFSPTHISLEDIVLFMAGKSTAKTIAGLAILNRTVGLAIFDEIGRAPLLLNVLSIRHAIKNKVLPAKEEIPDLVSSILGIPFPYAYDKKARIAVESYDMADSIAVGLATVHFLKNPKKLPKKKLPKKKVIKKV